MCYTTNKRTVRDQLIYEIKLGADQKYCEKNGWENFAETKNNSRGQQRSDINKKSWVYHISAP